MRNYLLIILKFFTKLPKDKKNIKRYYNFRKNNVVWFIEHINQKYRLC